MVRRLLVVDDSVTLRRIMASVLTDAGYEVDTAADGAEALDRAQRVSFDLLLTDFIMPRLNGYQLAQAIRSVPALRGLPVVLVSARTEQIGARFMAQTGAVGTLSKPFTPQQLLETVTRALETAPHEPIAGTGSWLAASEGSTDYSYSTEGFRITLPPETSGSAHSSVQRKPLEPTNPGSVPPGAAHAQSLATQEAAYARFTELLAQSIEPCVRDVAGAEVSGQSLLQALRYHLPMAAVSSLARELRPFDPGLRGAVTLDGVIGAVPLGEVFQLFSLQAQTGLLVVERALRQGSPLITIAFRHGRIDQCVGHGVPQEYLLGRYLRAVTGLSRAEVDGVAAACQGQRVLLGQALVGAGRVTQDDLDRALTHQTCELLYESLRWGAGRFRFESGAVLPEALQARLDLAPENLVLEGFRRLDEWRLIQEYIPSDRLVLARDVNFAALSPDELDADEQRVFDAVNGRRSVREVVGEVVMSTFETCKILYRLMRARLVAPVAA